mmetsp:Transcript_10150/g.23733  ORF Transcript_10150/g.23733 Transcript_10150/m.23733 type:complete len:176 (+) Transcript_10150:76-603(+)
MIENMSSSKFWVLAGYPTGRDPRDVLLEPGVHNDSFWVLATHDMTMVFLRLEADASESEVRGMFGEGYIMVDEVEANKAESAAMHVREHGERVAGAAQEPDAHAAALVDEVIRELGEEVLADMESFMAPVPLREVRPDVDVEALVDEVDRVLSLVGPLHLMVMGASMEFEVDGVV